jgi:hypothetical protein
MKPNTHAKSTRSGNRLSLKALQSLCISTKQQTPSEEENSDCTSLTDVGLQHLSSLHTLTSLDLSSANLTGFGLQHLSSLHALTTLNIYGCKRLTDAGLQHLSSLHALTTLKLSGCTSLTDAGLQHLSSLHALRSLDLSFTDLTRVRRQHLADVDL